jgi:hypothetical protein
LAEKEEIEEDGACSRGRSGHPWIILLPSFKLFYKVIYSCLDIGQLEFICYLVFRIWNLI